MQYLIYCDYDYYCQGMEKASGYRLVVAETFEHACNKLYAMTDGFNFSNPRNFKNMTIQ